MKDNLTFHRIWILCGLLLAGACEKTEKDTIVSETAKETLFSLLPPDSTGIDFVNYVENRNDFNIFKYRNFYNGGGVALGDINNDGLVDVFLTGNMVPNSFYLN